MFVKMPEPVEIALDLLMKSGYEAFIVGGCVRDLKLGKEPHDWDITTNALPEDTKAVFTDFKIIETGIKHGTVTVLILGMPLEITTYRMDGEYSDNRHPDSVSFTPNLIDDLSRRDFTINALAYNQNRKLVDEFSGVSDLESRIIRAIGDPDKRFGEDSLRILRALRFAAVLDFSIEENTKNSIIKNKDLLLNVSAERITEELLKFLCGEGRRVTSLLIEYRSVFAVIIPELIPCFDFEHHNKHHIYDVYDHIAYAVGYSKPIPEIRLALLLHDIGKPECYFTDADGVGHFYGHGDVSYEISKVVLKRLRLTNKMYDDVTALVKYHDCPIEADKKIIRRRLAKFGPELLKKLMLVKEGDSLAHNPKLQFPTEGLRVISRMIEEMSQSGECFSTKDLALNGNDIIALGCEKGPRVGAVLNRLLEKVMSENIPNDRDELMAYAKKIIEESVS